MLSEQLKFIIETFELLKNSSSAKFDLLFVNTINVQLQVHLKKWTLKFKLLYSVEQNQLFQWHLQDNM